MAENRLDIIINAKDKTSKAFKKVDKNMAKTTSAAKKLGGALVGLFAFKKLADFVWSATEAFGEQEFAEAKLQEIMTRVNHSTEEQIHQMKEQAKALQEVTVVGDEVVITLQAQLGTFALSADAVMALTENTLDLAIANKGVNLTTEDMINYGNLVGKVMAGQVGALSRYGVSLSETQMEQLKSGNEMERAILLSEVLQGNYGDLARAMGTTLEGKIKRFKNAWGDMKELIGEELMPVLSDLLLWATKTGIPKIIEAGSWLKKRWEDNFLGIRTVLTESVAIIKLAISGWIQAIQLLVSAWDRATEALSLYKRKALSMGAGSLEEFQALNPAPDIEAIRRQTVEAQKAAVAALPALGGGGAAGAKAGGGAGGADKEKALIEEIKSRIEGLRETRARHRQSVLDSEEAIKELNEAYREEIEESQNAIKNLEDSILSLQSVFESDKSAFGQRRLEEIVQQEEKIKALKEEIEALVDAGTDTDRKGELEARLAEEQDALAKYKEFIENNEMAIQEIRDFNALTAFEQSMVRLDNEFQAKLEKFEEEKALLDKKLEAEKANLAKITAEHQKALDEMELQREKDLANYKSYLALRVAAYKRAQAEMGGGSAGGGAPLPQYARGGIVNSPVIAGEGTRPEAIVPLPDGRSIPVEVKGGGNRVIINFEGANFRDEEGKESVFRDLVRLLQQANLGVA